MKKNILYLIDTLETVGGTERHLFEASKILVESGDYRPFVYSLGPEGDFSRQFVQAGIPIQNLSIGRVYGVGGFKVLKHLEREVKKNDINLIHVFHFGAQLLGTALAKMLRKPLVLSIRDLGFWQKRHHRFIKRCLDPLADRITVVSEAVKTDMKKKGVSSDKISVIYNGVDLQGFKKLFDRMAFCRENGLILDVPAVVYLGWLRPEKGVAFFLGAAKQILKNGRKAQFWIIGDGPLRPELEVQAEDLGISSAVRFWGSRADIAKILSLAHVCVQPSITEGFSNTIIEAMAAGLPVVASRVGGNPEAIVDKETGFLVPAGDVSAMADKVQVLLQDDELRRRFGENARHRVEEKFDIRSICRQYRSVYEELLNKKTS